MFRKDNHDGDETIEIHVHFDGPDSNRFGLDEIEKLTEIEIRRLENQRDENRAKTDIDRRKAQLEGIRIMREFLCFYIRNEYGDYLSYDEAKEVVGQLSGEQLNQVRDQMEALAAEREAGKGAEDPVVPPTTATPSVRHSEE